MVTRFLEWLHHWFCGCDALNGLDDDDETFEEYCDRMRSLYTTEQALELSRSLKPTHRYIRGSGRLEPIGDSDD